MKKLIGIALILVLTGCGGFDDIDAMRDATIGSDGSTTNPSQPNRPSAPTDQKNWQYSSAAIDGKTFSLEAVNYALNDYFDPIYTNVKNKPWLDLEKRLSSDNSVTERVYIFAMSAVRCSPSCDVRMSFDGNWATYRMQNSSDGVITPLDRATEITLFKKFTSSNRATVSLPIIGLAQPFDANFDLSGYDLRQMRF